MAYSNDPNQSGTEPTPPGQGNLPTGGGYNPGQQVTVPNAPSIPDIPGSNYPAGGGYNPGAPSSYGAPAAGTTTPGGYTSGGYAPQTGLKPNDPNNPNNPAYAPQAQATGGGGAPPPGLNPADLMKMLGMDPAIQKQYADQQQQYLDFYTGKAFDLQKQIAAAQQSGNWEGARSLQGQLQDFQLKIAQTQQDMNNLLQSSQATGMYGSAPTQSYQQLMNQYALTQGNQNLTARGQDLSAMGVGAQYGLGMAGQYGNQASQLGQQQQGLLQGGSQYGLGLGNLAQGYGNTLTGVLGAQAGYDVQMQQLQNQMAQSPLVAWYTARGLPPPQSAIQSMQQSPDFAGVQRQQMDLQKQFADQSLGKGGNPLMQQYLQASQQAGGNQQTAFDRLMNKQDPNFNLGKFTPPDLKWNTQANNPNMPRTTIPFPDANKLYNTSMDAYRALRAQGKPWTREAFQGIYQQMGIPPEISSQVWDQAGKSGVPQDPQALLGMITPIIEQYNQTQTGPVGLPYQGAGGQSGSSYTPPGAGSYGQYQPLPPGGGAPQEPGAEQPGPFARSGAMTSPLAQQDAAAAGGGPGMPMRSGAMLSPLNQGGAPQPPGLDQQMPFARSGAMLAPQGGDGRMSAAVMPGGGPTLGGPQRLGGPDAAMGGGMQGDVLDRNGQMISPGMGRDQMRPPMPSPTGQMLQSFGAQGQTPTGMSGQQQPPPNVPPMSNGAPPWAQAAMSGQNLASFTGLGSALPFLNPQQWNNLLPQEKQAYLQVAQSQGMSPQDFLQAQTNSQPSWGAMPSQARYQSY